MLTRPHGLGQSVAAPCTGKHVRPGTTGLLMILHFSLGCIFYSLMCQKFLLLLGETGKELRVPVL